jgi:hypothetical protein
MEALSELKNQARPSRRPAVYGKRRQTNVNTKELHRQLFGTDENDIESGLRTLSISAEPNTKVRAGRETQPEVVEEAIQCPERRHAKSPISPLKRKRAPIVAADVEVDNIALSTSHIAQPQKIQPLKVPGPELTTWREARKATGRPKRKKKIPVSTIVGHSLYKYRSNADRSCRRQKNSD